MGLKDFWTELFCQRIREMSPPIEFKDAPLLLAVGHNKLYRSYLGTSSMSWNKTECIWTFICCRHANCGRVCEAHQGFIIGTLLGIGFESVKVDRERHDSKCQLRLQWRQP
jgi:hypothetical protein